METPARLWSQHLANSARAAFWLLLVIVILLQLAGSRGLDRQRSAALGQFERERNSRVIAMIHRQEGGSLFGVPVAGSISIDDSEAVLRAIRLTPPEQPIDIILHTPGGLVLAAEQIAKALVERKGKVTVFVPHYAMRCGGRCRPWWTSIRGAAASGPRSGTCGCAGFRGGGACRRSGRRIPAPKEKATPRDASPASTVTPPAES